MMFFHLVAVRRPVLPCASSGTAGLVPRPSPAGVAAPPAVTGRSTYGADDLDCVAAELNDRPRKRLGFKKPIEQIGPLLLR
jgi:hypothetical protein